MAKKKAKSQAKPKRELSRKGPEHFGLTVADVMAHPAFVDMARRLDEVKALIANLPGLVGRTVAEAIQVSTTSGPPVPLDDSNEVEFHPRRIVADGKEYDVPRNEVDKMARPRMGVNWPIRVSMANGCAPRQVKLRESRSTPQR